MTPTHFKVRLPGLLSGSQGRVPVTEGKGSYLPSTHNAPGASDVLPAFNSQERYDTGALPRVHDTRKPRPPPWSAAGAGEGLAPKAQIWLRSPGATEVTRAARPGVQATGPPAVRATNSKRRPCEPQGQSLLQCLGRHSGPRRLSGGPRGPRARPRLRSPDQDPDPRPEARSARAGARRETAPFTSAAAIHA